MRKALTKAVECLSSAPLRSALVVSITLHGLAAWTITWNILDQPAAPIAVTLQLDDNSGGPTDTDSSKVPGRDLAKPRATPSRGRPTPGPIVGSPAPGSAGNRSDGNLGAEIPASAGLGAAVSDPGGIAVAGGGSGGVGDFSTPSKNGGGTGPASSSAGRPGGQGSPGPARTARPAVIPPIVIPPSISGSTASHEGAVYYEVDSYVLFAPGMRVGIAVPGNEICREGDRIRTIQPFESVEKKTDISKCQILEYGEDRREECSAGAHSLVRSSYHLSSPVNYRVNSCVAYDRSNCNWRDEGDGRDQQVCKAPSPYDGIWAADTQFHYRCAQSESKAFSHPLQYQVRFLRDVEYQERSISRRVLLRESRSILPCQ